MKINKFFYFFAEVSIEDLMKHLGKKNFDAKEIMCMIVSLLFKRQFNK